ncbi:hypothetical protein O3Q52_04700 [Streptomyces sp. ActVer]|nr:hypothetical protein [Streptomyces sp. ActVer]
MGFFVAPALVTPALDNLGMGATALFIPPSVLMGFVLLRHHNRTSDTAVKTVQRQGKDRPGRFAALTAVEIVRSTISTGLNTFISLYWIRHLEASSGLGGLALALALGGGVAGTLLGGRLADRFGMVRTVQIGNAAMLPALWLMLVCDDEYVALPLALLVRLISNIPFAVLIKLGQDYLPSRPGTAAGVTLGLAMSAGGLFMPLLGIHRDPLRSPRRTRGTRHSAGTRDAALRLLARTSPGRTDARRGQAPHRHLTFRSDTRCCALPDARAAVNPTSCAATPMPR